MTGLLLSRDKSLVCTGHKWWCGISGPSPTTCRTSEMRGVIAWAALNGGYFAFGHSVSVICRGGQYYPVLRQEEVFFCFIARLTEEKMCVRKGYSEYEIRKSRNK
ncbi:hypothetical protein AVEN_223989-1 [Araneus ventricosus]|uniref:Uncharacterized protein n=1 Tax=Araneus ventricosus TaxID=182803 RepID=A0A4Y2L1L1_ARAVE|nr:hypothetical protein AVEN_223989-1 [Araneus ventricosus]